MGVNCHLYNWESCIVSIDVIFQHHDWLAAIKPAGLNFHSEDGEAGFVVQLEQQLGIKLWPVHRLDKLTSGILLLAKSKETCQILSELFAQRQVEKYYLAICSSKIKKKQGLIKGDMAAARRGAYKLLMTQQNPALTQFFSTTLQPGLRLCLLKPKTGKTHQLRVALKSLSAPILGDSLYGGDAARRLYLHSFAIKFEYDTEIFTLQALPEADDIFTVENVLKQQDWLQPWSLKWPKL